MKRNRMKVLGWLRWFQVLVVILWGVNSVQAQTIGKTVDKSNVQEYKDLLIPALFRAVERGDFILPTANLGFPFRHWDRFLIASEKNAGKFDVNEGGDLIDKTGKFPTYNIYGFPFPKIDPKDPKAGPKIIWNFSFQKYRLMGGDMTGRVQWVGRGEIGVERYLDMHTNFFCFQGRSPGNEVKRNPQGYLYLRFDRVTAPMSMRGTNTLNWEYQDERENTVFAYVPVIRRARQTSGVARSDPFFGSDGWQDLSEMWGGKNRTMKWKLTGESTVLVPFTSIIKDIGEDAQDGTLLYKPAIMKYGYNTPGWKGASWAPTFVTWVPRQVYVLEQWPLNPYYNWGLHINYVDKETSTIWMKEVYTKGGEFRTWILGSSHYTEGPSGNNNIGIPDDYNVIDEKIRHASLTPLQLYPGTGLFKMFMPNSRLGPDIFTVSNFLQESK